MVYRNDLEVAVRRMVAYDIISKPLVSIGHKADRRRDKISKEAAGLLNMEISERIVAYVEPREEEKSRTLRDGINAFKKEHSRYGKILEGMIQEKRVKKNKYLMFKIADGFQLGDRDYRSVMVDLGLSSREADAMYPHLLEIGDRLGKARENSLRSILL